MTTKTAARTDARRDQAEGRLRIIRNALGVADEELEAALLNRDWEVFDLPSFEAYCAEKIPEFRHFKMRPEPRNERIDRLHRQGATIPQIVAATNSSLGTVHRRLQALEGGHKREPVSTWKEESATPPNIPTHVQAAQAIRRCGPGGGTTLEVIGRLGWRQGPASVALSRAAKKGLVVATGERRHAEGSSPGFAVYVSA